MPIKILISGGGAASTIGIIRTLKPTGRYEIVALDAEPYSYGLKIADSAYLAPYGSAPGFQRALEAIVERERPRYLIPLIDAEIAAFHAIAGRFHARVVAPVPAFCRMSFDKWLTYEGLSQAGISMPQTHLATVDPNRVSYPAVVKPRCSTGSRGIAYLKEPRDLVAYLDSAPQPPDAYVVQQRLEGKEFSVSVVVGLGGPVLAVVPKESLVKRGMSIAAVTRRCPEIDSISRRIQDRLRPDGPFNLQLFLTPEGRLQVLEINPRFSGSIPLTIAAGVHEVDLIIRHAEGEKLEPIDFTPDLLMIRYHVDEYLPETQWESLLAGRDLRCLVKNSSRA
jgi:carbamoyl-phosphate synthase large subunit